MCGALAIRLPCGVKQRAAKVQALFDVDRVGGVLQLQAHLLGNVHEQVVKHLQQHRVCRGARRKFDSALRCARAPDGQTPSSLASQPGSTTVVAFFSAMMAGPGIMSPGTQVFAHHQRRVMPLAARVHAHRFAARHCARCMQRMARLGGRIASDHRFDRHRLHHQALPCIKKAKRCW